MPSNLTPLQEAEFLRWYRDWADRTGINPNPDDPLHYYDYRKAYINKASPTWNEEDQSYHWDSRYKIKGHPRQIIDGIDTITGLPVK